MPKKRHQPEEIGAKLLQVGTAAVHLRPFHGYRKFVLVMHSTAIGGASGSSKGKG